MSGARKRMAQYRVIVLLNELIPPNFYKPQWRNLDNYWKVCLRDSDSR
jgi:hypothetical protein